MSTRCVPNAVPARGPELSIQQHHGVPELPLRSPGNARVPVPAGPAVPQPQRVGLHWCANCNSAEVLYSYYPVAVFYFCPAVPTVEFYGHLLCRACSCVSVWHARRTRSHVQSVAV